MVFTRSSLSRRGDDGEEDGELPQCAPEVAVRETSGLGLIHLADLVRFHPRSKLKLAYKLYYKRGGGSKMAGK
jgi:hypothetical protein